MSTRGTGAAIIPCHIRRLQNPRSTQLSVFVHGLLLEICLASSEHRARVNVRYRGGGDQLQGLLLCTCIMMYVVSYTRNSESGKGITTCFLPSRGVEGDERWDFPVSTPVIHFALLSFPVIPLISSQKFLSVRTAQLRAVLLSTPESIYQIA
ncbi:hypothetical protein K503DRAFT_68991 [Rhizopogon vinicolor AM-OR11-026]|uniref:Uncharacterized protein n=1 Tax=Rhizopogon vinicolor AM-OR11-026 TaxID=1314800 RepID=A0A1B7N4B1_9AGAM|nr:hypothetical protein K503DRAFT_68991 [Rhizopogon vinicolor AM-OR11-026]